MSVPVPSAIARALLLQAQLEEIERLTADICRVVPLKGISLLLTLYNEDYNRPVGDIDLLVMPGEAMDDFISRMQHAGYTLQFDFMTDSEARHCKRKVALRPVDPTRRTDVDVHTALVTKKFFSRSVEAFNRDALSRLIEAKNSPRLRLDPTDEWLFLAQHALFHLFSQEKWTRDLLLPYPALPAGQLTARARRYGFGRTVALTFAALEKAYPLRFERAKSDREWNAPAELCSLLTAKGLKKRLWKAFLEFEVIDDADERRRALRRLYRPERALLENIYRTRNGFALALLRPLHHLVARLGHGLFRLFCR